jgi:hypothetical protein
VTTTRRLTALAFICTTLLTAPAILQWAIAQQTDEPKEAQDHAMPSTSAEPSVPAGPAAAPAAKRLPAPHDAYVYIGWPNDGEVIHSTHVKVWFGTRNFGVAPAGTNVPSTGHHHLLIDTALPPMDEAIPNDKRHLHFGRGQTETSLDLPPGTHTLQLLMGDADHVPHDPPVMSKRITIRVLAEKGEAAASTN